MKRSDRHWIALLLLLVVANTAPQEMKLMWFALAILNGAFSIACQIWSDDK
jgi:hypothetical protein